MVDSDSGNLCSWQQRISAYPLQKDILHRIPQPRQSTESRERLTNTRWLSTSYDLVNYVVLVRYFVISLVEHYLSEVMSLGLLD